MASAVGLPSLVPKELKFPTGIFLVVHRSPAHPFSSSDIQNRARLKQPFTLNIETFVKHTDTHSDTDAGKSQVLLPRAVFSLILPSDPSSERPSPGVWEPLQAVKPDGQVHRKLVMAAATL